MLLNLWRMCKNVFPWRPQVTKCFKICWRPVLSSENMVKMHIEAHSKRRIVTFRERDRLSSPGMKRLRQSRPKPSRLHFSISPTYGGREMHSVFALSDFRKRIPKIDSLSKRIPKMDWWPRDAFRIRIIRFPKTDSLSKRILKMDSLWNRIHKMDSPSKRLTKPKTLKTFA